MAGGIKTGAVHRHLGLQILPVQVGRGNQALEAMHGHPADPRGEAG